MIIHPFRKLTYAQKTRCSLSCLNNFICHCSLLTGLRFSHVLSFHLHFNSHSCLHYHRFLLNVRFSGRALFHILTQCEGTGALSEDVKQGSAGETNVEEKPVVVETGMRVEVQVETQDMGEPQASEQTTVADKVVKAAKATTRFLGIRQFPEGVYDYDFPIRSFLIGAGALASSLMHALQ